MATVYSLPKPLLILSVNFENNKKVTNKQSKNNHKTWFIQDNCNWSYSDFHRTFLQMSPRNLIIVLIFEIYQKSNNHTKINKYTFILTVEQTACVITNDGGRPSRDCRTTSFNSTFDRATCPLKSCKFSFSELKFFTKASKKQFFFLNFEFKKQLNN